MRMRRLLFPATLLALVCVFSLPAYADEDKERVIIKAPKPYNNVIAAVQRMGGEVDFQFENVDAIAARVPKSRLADVAALAGVKVMKDVLVAPPKPVTTVGRIPNKSLAVGQQIAEGVRVLETATLASFAASLPTDYAFNNTLIGATPLHAQGKLGQNVIVGVIDTGTANSPVVPAISGTVVGGENFVAGDPVQSATSRRNDPHGTWVGTVIAGHVAFGFSNSSLLVRSLKNNGAGTFIGPCPAPSTPTICFVPMIGVAPLSKIYALKVFDSRGGGAPDSRIVAAMDRAISLRRNFNNGMSTAPVSGDGSENNPFKYNAVNIQVVNMSLGGPTLFAGNDLEDLLTLEMLKVGITIAAAAGNDGFPAMTGGSPGTGLGGITAGASSTSTHERILRDLQFGLGIGALYRPTTHTQTAYFSSRGPTADGRLDPDVVANGFATFAQGTCSGAAGCLAGTAIAPISLVSGTSFASPTVAGAAALLRGATASPSATQIRNALIASANAAALGDGSGPIDQGNGLINVSAALTQLNSGGVSSKIARNEQSDDSVQRNIAPLGFRPVNFNNDIFSGHIGNLKPGQVAQFFVSTKRDTDRLVVTLRNVTPELPPSQQNFFFGDDVFFQIADAPTSFNQNLVFDFVPNTATYTINNPQTGLVRVALQGDWTNAGRVSADLEIRQSRRPLGPETAEGEVGQGDLIPIRVQIPAGTKQADFSLFWERDWASYPTNDIDLILLDPNGVLNFDGATLNSPERVSISTPAPGTWIAYVNGFTINGGDGEKDQFKLRVTLDGKRLGGD